MYVGGASVSVETAFGHYIVAGMSQAITRQWWWKVGRTVAGRGREVTWRGVGNQTKAVLCMSNQPILWYYWYQGARHIPTCRQWPNQQANILGKPSKPSEPCVLLPNQAMAMWRDVKAGGGGVVTSGIIPQSLLTIAIVKPSILLLLLWCSYAAPNTQNLPSQLLVDPPVDQGGVC